MKAFFVKLGRWTKVRYILVRGIMHMLRAMMMDCARHKIAWDLDTQQAIDDVLTDSYYRKCASDMVKWAEHKFGITEKEMDEAWKWS